MQQRLRRHSFSDNAFTGVDKSLVGKRSSEEGDRSESCKAIADDYHEDGLDDGFWHQIRVQIEDAHQADRLTEKDRDPLTAMMTCQCNLTPAQAVKPQSLGAFKVIAHRRNAERPTLEEMSEGMLIQN